MTSPDGSAPRVLAVDDNEDALYALEKVLQKHGFEVVTATSGHEALEKTSSESPDLVLLDVMMPGMNGYEVTRTIKTDPVLRFIPVILLTANDDLEDIIRGLEEGADDYIKKPFKPEELIARLKAAMRTQKLYRELRTVTQLNTQLTSRAEERHSFANLIGKSSSMRDIYALIEKVADSHVPVLITGESGTGKELVASAIHYNSSRKGRSFVVQNCSAFNENLLESELFGHVKGSFSGAIRDKQGLFEVADGGTFFLDELGEMSMSLQAKLLRVLQDGTFMPVGATRQKKVDVRIVAATNRNLQEMVQKGTFREDLYYRLNVVNIRIPPLRERKVDIPLLVEHFLKKLATDGRKTVAPETLKLLSDYDWPGNIRQLQNEIERLNLMAGKSELITPDLLSPNILGHGRENARGRRVEGKLKDAVENLERNMILDALEKLDWNKSEAAKILGISRSNLIAKVQAYGLEK